ncbi:radical SAM protein [Streptomyces sp. NBC_00201]|uniref:radical SAM protein n=1 Tax=unclassified Streptomyces TaxID=2593676 RepID=UPI002257B2A1|nr:MULTISPECIES: radical SAM protein [unclassified Streptomyces]MCX5250627.1 radical SAM protein [Streptomyces sp. NBC_00201]MCX5291444.1 radical SAM protein [Streptomyces sp. NBC_00183]
MHDLIAAPFQDDHLVLRPGSPKALKIPPVKFAELKAAVSSGDMIPTWLSDAAGRAWRIDVAGRTAAETVLVRAGGPYEFSRATWEINLGCDYDCVMCYLGEKRFEGLDMEGKRRLLQVMAEAGVIWLQITGGEPLIDPDFPEAYEYAHALGMQLEVLSNGSRLHKPHILELLTRLPPSKMSLSVYGATADTYDTVTRNRGAFDRFSVGLDKALAAGLNLDLSLIITRQNAHEADATRTWARRLGLPFREYANLSPTIHGTAEPLPSQSPEHLTHRAPFIGCPAGVTFFHADPFGRASICKVGRKPNVDLIAEGVEGLTRLGGIAESLMLRTGGCTGCKLSGTCRVCRPMARVFQKAEAPLHHYCQHTPKEVAR